VARPSVQPSGGSATAQLEQRLGTAQVELRKLGSERHTLRSRLRRESDRVRELESALRAEKELRGHATEEHLAAQAGLRERLSALEAERDALGRENAQLKAARPAAAPSAGSSAPPAAAGKVLSGLRRIRGIGPAYQRALEQLGVTRVEQVAAWTAEDVRSFAQKLRIKAERISKDDWVGQAGQLEPEE
jgi:predicted flap endonuclease-1-like 5' DNA nuclease